MTKLKTNDPLKKIKQQQVVLLLEEREREREREREEREREREKRERDRHRDQQTQKAIPQVQKKSKQQQVLLSVGKEVYSDRNDERLNSLNLRSAFSVPVKGLHHTDSGADAICQGFMVWRIVLSIGVLTSVML